MDVSRRDGVDPDVVGRKLPGQGPGEPQDPGLGGAVGGRPGAARGAHDAAHVDDRSATLRPVLIGGEQSDCRAAAVERAVEVDGQHAPPGFVAHLQDRRVDVGHLTARGGVCPLERALYPQLSVAVALDATDAGVVDENVEAVCDGGDLLEHSVDGGRVAHVAGQCPAPDGGSRGLCRIEVEIVHDHHGAFLGEPPCHLRAEAPGGARDQRRSACQSVQCRSSSPVPMDVLAIKCG